MWTDPVLWGTLLATIIFLYGGLLYSYKIKIGRNGHFQDSYIAILFFALFSNYGYLCYARVQLYLDPEKFQFLLARSKYLPPVYIVLFVALVMVVHATIALIKEKK